jgi:hypothetical protein
VDYVLYQVDHAVFIKSVTCSLNSLPVIINIRNVASIAGGRLNVCRLNIQYRGDASLL